jgi:tRNA(Ile)-lysidine synthase
LIDRDLLSRFRAHLLERQLFVEGDRILVGYSGGPDSTCLLHLLHQVGLDIVAGHLHHGQRAEGEAELKLCEAFCADLGVPFAAGRSDVPEMARIMKIGLEEAGRRARYEFFRQASFRLDCTRIATAHTLDDHVETVLLNLTRGCGIAGLAGIPERRENIVRPLLLFSKEETRQYCEAHGLWTHDDPANCDVNFSRARIRHRVLPELVAINPNATEAVSRLSRLAFEENRYLDSQSVHAIANTEVLLNGSLRFLTIRHEAAFDRVAWRSIPPVLVRRALKLVASALNADLDFEQTHVAAEGIAGTGSGSVTSEGDVVVVEWSDRLVHVREAKTPEPFRFPLTVPGVTDSAEFGWKIEAMAGEPRSFARDALDVVVDHDRVQGPLHFRSVQPGDKMSPMGFSGSRKVSDLLGEAGLTASARRRLPLICDILGVVWVPGVSLADRVKTDASTERGLHMRFSPLETGAISPT